MRSPARLPVRILTLCRMADWEAGPTFRYLLLHPPSASSRDRAASARKVPRVRHCGGGLGNLPRCVQTLEHFFLFFATVRRGATPHVRGQASDERKTRRWMRRRIVHESWWSAARTAPPPPLPPR